MIFSIRPWKLVRELLVDAAKETKNILDKFDAAGMEIMAPHYYALRDGNASAVPSVLEAKGYVSPAFKVSKGAE
jgi:hypothetical protein